MYRTILPETEVETAKGVVEAVDRYVLNHSKLEVPKFEGKTDASKLFSLVYLDLMGDVVSKVACLRDLLKVKTEEEFIAIATQEGKVSLEEVLDFTLHKMFLKSLEGLKEKHI